MLLHKLRNTQTTSRQQVYLIKAIRKAISCVEEPPTTDLFSSTDLVQIVAQILAFEDSAEEIRVLKYEALWILTNLASAPAYEIQSIF